MPKGTVCLEFLIQQPGQVPTVITHESLTVWSWEMDHQKDERVTYQIGIQNF
jgi:DNA-binding winged helix-turn-helix (wHTH) protein